MTADEDAAGYVRDGKPPFIDVYDRIRGFVARSGLVAGDPLPGEVALAGQLGVTRDLAREALLLLEEDGKLVRRERRWEVAERPSGPTEFSDSFHRLLRPEPRPVRRLLVDVEDGSMWSHELLRTEGRLLTWETVFAHDDVLLASTLEMMVVEAAPPELLEPEALALDKQDVARWPTLLEALGAERRSGLSAEIWRLSTISRATERLSWMELPLHGIPSAVTVVLTENGAPVYLAKNIVDLGTFDLVVDQLAP